MLIFTRSVRQSAGYPILPTNRIIDELMQRFHGRTYKSTCLLQDQLWWQRLQITTRRMNMQGTIKNTFKAQVRLKPLFLIFF